jgi:hypothetical protein
LVASTDAERAWGPGSDEPDMENDEEPVLFNGESCPLSGATTCLFSSVNERPRGSYLLMLGWDVDPSRLLFHLAVSCFPFNSSQNVGTITAQHHFSSLCNRMINSTLSGSLKLNLALYGT